MSARHVPVKVLEESNSFDRVKGRGFQGSTTGWGFDPATLTPGQTADRIVREAGRRALVN